MSYDLTNQNIEDTFQNLLQRTGSDNHLYDLKGNKIGDLRISGSLIAQEYVVSSSVTNITTQQLSGSTAFGDTTDDTHSFTGSLSVTGSGTNLTVDGKVHFTDRALIGPAIDYGQELIIKGSNPEILLYVHCPSKSVRKSLMGRGSVGIVTPKRLQRLSKSLIYLLFPSAID